MLQKLASASPEIVMFGSARPVTCAVMDYAARLISAINARRPGLSALCTIEPDRPTAFVGAIADALREDRVVHVQLPVEGWGNSVVPGSALFAARALTRRGSLVVTLHEWTSLNRLRYLSMIPDLLATDRFIFVSQAQREAFQRTRLVRRAKREAAPVIPIGPNIMPEATDPAHVARERAKLVGEGSRKADIVIGFFGVLYASKRPDLLLRATKALHERGVKARLLVCGDFLWDKPGDRDAFMALARQLDLDDWLDFRGRIDDEAELVGTLAASDVFLLPYADGISARRGSFQAVSKLAIPLVSTHPADPAEFAASPLLRAKVENAATVLRPADASAEIFAEAILEARSRRAEAVSVDLAALWDEAAREHLRLYDSLRA
jgi:glycosyltransferase involved in cell wall biosynthesis